MLERVSVYLQIEYSVPHEDTMSRTPFNHNPSPWDKKCRYRTYSYGTVLPKDSMTFTKENLRSVFRSDGPPRNIHISHKRCGCVSADHRRCNINFVPGYVNFVQIPCRIFTSVVKFPCEALKKFQGSDSLEQ